MMRAWILIVVLGLGCGAPATPEKAVAAAAEDAAVPASGEAVVIAALENMYSGPGEDRDVVNQVVLGQTVELRATRGGFVEIAARGYPGWVPATALRHYGGPGEPRYAAQGRVAEVTALLALVYREPDVTKHRPLARAPLGARLEVTAEVDERWLSLRMPDDGVAYVQRGDVEVVDAGRGAARASDGAARVATARRFLGVPYLWGGMSAQGIDCSGLAHTVHAFHGIAVPRDADQQFEDPRGVPVEREALEAGDLVFFGKQKITHVGMYIAAGRFIHATTNTRPVVQESGLDEPTWAALYRGARRFAAQAPQNPTEANSGAGSASR